MVHSPPMTPPPAAFRAGMPAALGPHRAVRPPGAASFPLGFRGVGRMGPMQAEERRPQLRGAVYRSHAVAVVALLRGQPWPQNALQLIGDGLTVALGRHVPDAAVLAQACVAELRDRGWHGDDDLADQLDGLLGSGRCRCCVRYRSTWRSWPGCWRVIRCPVAGGWT